MLQYISLFLRCDEGHVYCLFVVGYRVKVVACIDASTAGGRRRPHSIFLLFCSGVELSLSKRDTGTPDR
jgi:hypothetical protein